MADESATQTAPPIVGQDLNFAENWHEGREDMAPYVEEAKRTKNLPALFKRLADTRAKLGKDPDSLVEIPNEHSTDEVRAAFRQKALGVSDKDEDYGYEISPETKAVIGDLDPERVKAAQKFARDELDLSPAKFKKLMDFYTKMTADDTTAFDSRMQTQTELEKEQGMAALKKQYGDATEEIIAGVDLLTLKYEGREAIQKLGLQNNPEFISFMARIYQDMSEARLKGLKPASSITPAQIDAQIAEIRQKMANLPMGDPQLKALDVQLNELYQKKTGGK
jgi:hypothetical protein